jgi:carboxypeptidase Taq
VSKAWDRLLPTLEELRDISSAARLLAWDQAAMMPPKGAGTRAHAMATIEAIAHARLTDPNVGEALEELAEDQSLDDAQKAHVRVLRRDFERAIKVPPELVRAIAERTAHAYQAWTKARAASDFSILEPELTTLFDLKKQEADAIGWEEERYDSLLDQYEPGSTTVEIEAMFTELSGGLRPLADAILDAAREPPSFRHGDYDEDKQKSLCNWLASHLGFDADGGRLDTSPHPFTMPIGDGDVRQTTFTDRKALLSSIYAVIHETGHALYEQGLPGELVGLPAGRVPSLGMHESQSRLWENQVGRSRPFTNFLLPHLKEVFPEELGMVTPEEFHRGVNHPERTLIRIYADEVTYNLHVVLRFRLELAIFRDELEVADLPDAWDEAMLRTVGVQPEDDASGVLQDMHWSIGAMGYFPTYTIGTLYAAAFYRKADEDLGGLDDELRAGKTERLLDWLRTNIHSHAYLLPAPELARKVLGEPPGAGPFLEYLRAKYSDIYGMSL